MTGLLPGGDVRPWDQIDSERNDPEPAEPDLNGDEQGRTVTMTPAAAEALQRLIAEHGPLAIHIPGGAEDAGSPVVLEAGDLLLGPRDLLVGRAGNVPVYRMPSRPSGLEPDRHYRLDVIRAMPVGFSLSPGDGQAFSLREILVASE